MKRQSNYDLKHCWQTRTCLTDSNLESIAQVEFSCIIESVIVVENVHENSIIGSVGESD